MKKLWVSLMICMLVCASVTGCGKKGELSKDELIALCAKEKSERLAAEQDVDSLKRILQGYDSELAQVQDLNTNCIMPTGEKAYISIKDRIYLDTDIDLKPSLIVPNETTIKITDKILFKPNNNWTIQLNNGEVSMSHTKGIYANMKAYNYVGKEDAWSSYDTILKPHLEEMGAAEKSQRSIFIGSGFAGYMVTSTIQVADGQDVFETTLEGFKDADKNNEMMGESSSPVDESEGTDTTEPETGAEVSTEESKESSTEPSTVTDETQEQETDESGNPIETEPAPEMKYKTYKYVCGVLMKDQTAIAIKFLYTEGNDEVAYDEVITNCLTSINIDGSNVALQ